MISVQYSEYHEVMGTYNPVPCTASPNTASRSGKKDLLGVPGEGDPGAGRPRRSDRAGERNIKRPGTDPGREKALPSG